MNKHIHIYPEDVADEHYSDGIDELLCGLGEDRVAILITYGPDDLAKCHEAAVMVGDKCFSAGHDVTVARAP